MPAAPRSSHPALPWLAALAVVVLWASSFIGIRFSGVHLSPGAMTLLRVGTAALVLLPLVTLGRVHLPRGARMWAAVLGWGVAWFFLYLFVLNAAELYLDAATAAMLVSLAPLIVAVASGLLLGEGISARLLVGVVIALGGIGLITVATSTGHVVGPGLVLGLLAALLYAGSVLWQKPMLAHIDSTSMTVVGIWAGFLASLPFAPQLVAEVQVAPASAIASMVYLGVGPTAIAFLLWGYALTRTPAGVLTSSSLVIPALPVVMAWLMLGEVPPPLAAVGGVLCLAGAGVAILPSVVRSLRATRSLTVPDHTA